MLEQTVVLPASVDEIPDIFVYVLYRIKGLSQIPIFGGDDGDVRDGEQDNDDVVLSSLPPPPKELPSELGGGGSFDDDGSTATTDDLSTPIAVCYARLSARVLLRETSPAATSAAPGALRWVPLARDALTAPAALQRSDAPSAVWPLRRMVVGKDTRSSRVARHT